MKKEIFFLILRAEKMKLHIFNPEHDIALATNLSNFTAPHAGRRLRHDLGYLPAIWAEDGYVLVEDIEDAQRGYSRLMHKTFDRFVDKHMLAHLDIDSVEPWGWDLALRSYLLRYGVEAVPSEKEIDVIRDLSHRKHAVRLLGKLQDIGTVGRSWCLDSLYDVMGILFDHKHLVLKAPWSSSGRGIRFVDDEIDQFLGNWVNKTIERQGNIIVEEFNNKVKDFGMEFESDGEGGVRYLGLSLFHAQNGAYTGNILATEEEKMEMISRYLSSDRLNALKEKICDCLGALYKGRYKGPFGVDLMIVRGDKNVNFLLNPCVEINLRRTMGHVALELSKHFSSGSIMNIKYSEDKYRMSISYKNQ